MNTYEYKEAVENAVSNHNFHEAFRLLRVMLSSDNWRLRSDLESLEDDYSRIIDYALSGSPDPSREQQLSLLTTRIYGILDMLLRESLVAEHSSLYFNVVRTHRLRKNESFESLMAQYRDAERELSQFALLGASGGKSDALRRTAEDLADRVFERIWTTVPLAFDEIASIREVMADEAVPEASKAMMAGALTMSLLHFYNEQTLRLLLDFASAGNSPELKARATVGALLVMARWPKRTDTPAVRMQLDALRDAGSWSRNIRHAIMQVIRTADVEAMAKTMREEIIPEMMKLRPDLERHIKESGFNPADMEANPEWEEMLEKSGITDRLRKLSEMQEQGGDIFYPVFSMLKTYPFFNHIAHWFLPFTTSRAEVRQALGHDAALELMLEESPVMCASDKYSFALSVDRLPESQKQMLMSQLDDAAMGGAMLSMRQQRTEAEAVEQAISSYIHDLYRFVHLFRRRGEFYDPFGSLINPVAIPAVAQDFSDAESVRLLGEFYFKHGHFVEAIDLFRTLKPDLAIHQKIGYALQRLGRASEALVEYERAEMLAPESEWTLRRLAHVSKALGRHRQALDYFKRIEKLRPDNPEVALNMGHCYLELNDIREALHCYYKAEMLDESSTRALRPIAWSSFLNRDFETARRYFDRIMSELTPEPTDYMNMGHLSLATGNVREAMNYYSLSADDVDRVADLIREDLPLLGCAGVDVSLIPLVLDALRYKNDNR